MKVHESLQDSIKSGKYFKDATDWYNYKYVYPFCQRSILLISFVILLLMILTLGINIKGIFPIVSKEGYIVSTTDAYAKQTKILQANHIKHDMQLAIADILIRNYFEKRESYDYFRLRQQFNFLQNHSSKIMFKKFYDSIDTDNPESLILLYKKKKRKIVTILDIEHKTHGSATAKLKIDIKDKTNNIIDTQFVSANITYEMDDVRSNLVSGAKFNFIVTDYNSEPLDNLKL